MTSVPCFRVGIALGEVVLADATVTGAGVVLAQRLEQMAPRFGIENSVRTHLPYVPAAMSHYVRGLEKAGVRER